MTKVTNGWYASMVLASDLGKTWSDGNSSLNNIKPVGNEVVHKHLMAQVRVIIALTQTMRNQLLEEIDLDKEIIPLCVLQI